MATCMLSVRKGGGKEAAKKISLFAARRINIIILLKLTCSLIDVVLV